MSLARKVAVIMCVAFRLPAQPALTTIQDTIYKADGTRFNGTAVISWMPFDTSDNSMIGLQSLTTQIVNGSIRIQLVPNSNAIPVNNYRVRYSSDGRSQFTELWSVPPSATPLRIKDVRVTPGVASTSGGSGSGGVVTPPVTSPVTESDVIGLLTDLSLRALKGSSYANGAAAMIDISGAIDAVQGNMSDCVHVDGTSGSCGDSGSLPSFVSDETPGGTIDGSNATFTLANTVSPANSLLLSLNGLLLEAGVDYNIQGNGSILFVSTAVPQPGDVLLANYQDGGASSFVSNETPGGTIDGSNATFTLANTVSPANSLLLSLNGLTLQAGVDYNIQGSGSILFVSDAGPQPGDILLANYQASGLSANVSSPVHAQSSHAAWLSSQSAGPQILCSAPGTGTASAKATSMGSCMIPENTLSAGDRLEVRFSLTHQGTANGFTFSVLWGGAAMLKRSASRSDAIVNGHGDAAVGTGGVNFDMQTWGSVLPFQVGVTSVSGAVAGRVKVDFQAAMSAAGSDSVSLENYTVLRYPAH